MWEPIGVSVRHFNLRSDPSIRVKPSPEASAVYKGTAFSGWESVSGPLLAQADNANSKQTKITARSNTSIQVIQRMLFDSVQHSIHHRRHPSHVRAQCALHVGNLPDFAPAHAKSADFRQLILD